MGKHNNDIEKYKHIAQYIANLKRDQEECEAQHKAINRKAHMKAGINLAVGFLGCMAQLGGMGGAIYILFDWNTVEPWTWIFRKHQPSLTLVFVQSRST